MQSSTLQFLRNLEKNNNREWFNENKTLYQEAQQYVVSFVEKLIEEMATFDEEVGKVDAKKSLFRIYRDTRFSKDKSPYKTNFGASLGMGKGSQLAYRDWETDRKSTRLNSSHITRSRMPSSA